MSDIVTLSNVSKHFGRVIGVENVSLSVREGEFVTLLGPSGCGKSTLLRIVGGFEDPTAGSVWIDGREVTDLPPNKRPVNIVFQDYALFPHMSVIRNVGYGLKVAGVPRAEVVRRAVEALDLVGLGNRADAMPHQLSGGQRQRVALARAIVRRPKVLLLDEPLSALDANLRESMQVELKRLQRRVGLTFVMVTHDQTEALALSDRVIVMRDGRVVQDGTPETLYDRPADAYVAGFIGTTNLFEGRAEAGHVSAFGQRLALPPALAAAGRRATYGFRPEAADLLRADAAAPDALRGTVADVLYHGNSARVMVEMNGALVAVDCRIAGSRHASGLPEVGDHVAVHVAPERIMLLGDGVAA